MHKKFDVAILGSGVVGHTLALLLAQERLRVALVAPAPTSAGTAAVPDIRAYALNAASRALLQSVRAWPDDPTSITPVQHMWVAEGDASVRFDAHTSGAQALSWIVDVPALEQRLAQALHYQPGITVLHERPPAALTVVCEGKRSTSRDALGFTFDVRPYPHTAIAARLHCERPHGTVARQWFIDGAVLALLPLGGPHGHSVALVWSVAPQRAHDLLQLPAPALVAEVAHACGHALGEMELQGQAAGWQLELSRAQHWVQPGVALAGDAAHAMHPLAGQGLNVGLADVATLAQVLHQREYWRDLGDFKLLRRYERARQADLDTMRWATDGLFGLFQHTDTRIQALRRWGLRGFDRLTPLKHWITQQAAGHTTTA